MTDKLKLIWAKHGQKKYDELEGTFYFTSGSKDPKDKVFQFVALTNNEQFTLHIPLDAILEEIKKTMLSSE